ncbi:5667_t:CDS:2 [Cetraspora pellucida]|uniref:5667_t:CDS:1 n=1 Tax=Cetraspora pellucida TaxID=1433469 RepID=A0A9N9AYQ9_9GLOM|nr:5667_t:CDS:2 [Cetraspora pellucida]
MSKKQKITTLESNIQYENELTESSFKTTDNTIDLTESTSTEPMVKLTNTITEILSTSMYLTISDVRLTIIGLLRHLESFFETYSDTNLDECIIANSINFKLQEYWEYVDEPTTISVLLDL